MDRRRDQRFPAYFEATVTDLATGVRSSATFLTNLSQTGTCIVSTAQFAPSAVVKLEVADSVLFGHVVHCHSEGESFRIGIEITRVLVGETDLANLLNSMLIEAMPSTPGVIARG